jgi:hypothetical protein
MSMLSEPRAGPLKGRTIERARPKASTPSTSSSAAFSSASTRGGLPPIAPA